MADLKISELSALAGGNLAAADQLAIADSSASETKRITVTDLVGNATTLIADATIPGAKILFGTGDVGTTAIADGSVTDAKLAADSVTADKIADEVIVDLVTTLPASGAFVGQLALDTTDSTGYIWNGSSWVSFKAAGSVNAVVGDTSGIVNLNVSTVGDQVTITTTLDDTTAARQFLAGPTGAGGTVGYRQIVSGDIPTASTSKGGVAVNGNGLVMSGDTIQIDNTVVAETTEHHLVQYDANGLVTGGRVINAGDIPVATNTTVGTVKPGSGLGVDGTGDLSHSNAVVAGTATKFTFDTEGHVTATESLLDTDIPDLDAAKITTGEFPTARIANAGITAEKLANYSTASIAELTPASGDFIGQTHLNSITGDYFLWDGNVWQPIGISVGEIVLAGTYDASTNLIDTVTSEGTALGFTVGQGLPAPSNANSGYYVIVSLAGTGSPPAPTVQLNPPDFLLSNGSVWTEIDVSDTVVAQQAQNVAFTPAGDIQSTNVQGAIEELDTEKAPIASPVFTGNVTLDTAGTLIFEGATDNEFETTLTVADPTADRTLTLPNVSGNIVTTGDTGTVSSTMIVNGTIVDADVSATADIAVDKLAPGTARQLLQTNVAGNGVQFTSNVDVPGTLDVTGATTLDSSLTVTGLISADGNISFPAGTAALPSIYFSTDTNTGLYQSAADEVSISTAGTQRVVVDATGQVGIGTSSPSYQLHVRSADNTGFQVENTTGTASRINLKDINTTQQPQLGSAGNNLILRTAFLERMRIDSAGNVGIGTSNPGTPLSVLGESTLQGDVTITPTSTGGEGGQITLKNADKVSTGGVLDISTDNKMRLFQTADNSVLQIGQLAGTGGIIVFNTSVTERMRITSAGNVGIGTDNPGNPLHVQASSLARIQVETEGNIANADVAFYNSDGLQGVIGYSDSKDSLDFDSRSTTGAVTFSYSGSERMRIDSAGNVGIGTSNPGYKVDIQGGAENTYLRIRPNSTDTHQCGILFGEVGSAAPGQVIYSHVNDSLRFIANNSERMRITSTGNIGIGTDSPLSGYIFDARGAGRFESPGAAAGTGTGTLDVIGGNTSGTSRLNLGDLDDNDVGKLQYDHASNSLAIYTNAAEAMRIDSSGKVGIGTSNPQRKLHVDAGGGAGATYIQITNDDTGATASDGALLGLDTDENLIVWNQEATAVRFGTSAFERMRIDSAGRVGIGTNSPGQLLHLASSDPRLNIEDTDSTSIFQLRNTSGAGYLQVLGSSSMIFSTDSAERMRISGAGNVGIGTSSPGAKLETVVTSPGTAINIYRADMTTNNRSVTFSAPATDSASEPFTWQTGNSFSWVVDATDALRINGDGSVGVNQPTPAATLDVNGAYASNITAVAALDLDLSTANYFTKTIAANSTFTFSSPAASRAVSFTLELTHTSGTVTWPTSVKWPGDVAPTLTTGKTHLFMFVTDDGGTTYRGASLVDYTN